MPLDNLSCRCHYFCYKMSVHKDINDFPNQLLVHLLKFFQTKQLFQLEVVNKQWQLCARESIDKRITTLKLDNNCGRNMFSIENSTLCLHRSIGDHNIDAIKKILSKCTNIKTIILLTTDRKNLASIAHSLPKLECLNVSRQSDDSIEEMENFAQIIAPKLIVCNLVMEKPDIQKIIFKHLKVIEEIRFATKSEQEDEQLFYYLNLCKNIKKLSWEGSCDYMDDNSKLNQNIIDVLQRVNYLRINFYHFAKLNQPLDNLIELNFEVPFAFEAFGNKYNQINEMTFSNLKKLVTTITKPFLIEFLKLKFPQLEIFFVHNRDHLTDQKFFNQIKNIKELYSHGIQFKEGNLILLKNLVILKSFNRFEITKGIIDDMLKHDSLNDIFILNAVVEPTIIIDVFDQIIFLGQTKPDAKITIEFSFDEITQQQKQTLFEYKQKFQTNNWKVDCEENSNYKSKLIIQFKLRKCTI